MDDLIEQTVYQFSDVGVMIMMKCNGVNFIKREHDKSYYIKSKAIAEEFFNITKHKLKDLPSFDSVKVNRKKRILMRRGFKYIRTYSIKPHFYIFDLPKDFLHILVQRVASTSTISYNRILNIEYNRYLEYNALKELMFQMTVVMTEQKRIIEG
jgi:hypothetical protein